MPEAFEGPRSHPFQRPASATQPPGVASGPARLSPLALLSAIIAVVSPFLSVACLLSLPASAIAIVLGHVARSNIRRSGGKERGAGIALLGLCLAYITLAGSLVFLGFVGFHVITAPSSATRSEPAPSGAKAALEEAETKTLTDVHVKGQGNTPEARLFAERFATLMEEAHKEAFTSTRAKFKLSGGHYVTWCERHEGTCAFVVHVPEYRRFTSEAKDTLNELAWMAARLSTKGQLQPGERLAVGLRGVVLYGSVMVGTAGSDGTAGPVESSGSEGRALYPFFDREKDGPGTTASAENAVAENALPERRPVDYNPVARSSPPGSLLPPMTPNPLTTPNDPARFNPVTRLGLPTRNPPKPLGGGPPETPHGRAPRTNRSTAASTFPRTVTEPSGDLNSHPKAAEGLPSTGVPSPAGRLPVGPSRRRPASPRLADNTATPVPVSEMPSQNAPADALKPKLVIPRTAEEAADLLDAEDRGNRMMGQAYLSSHKPEAPDPEIARKILNAYEKAKPAEALSISSALEAWVTPDQLPELDDLLETTDRSFRRGLERAIGKMGTIEAAKILAKRLTDRHDRTTVARSLKSMGTIAEPAVIPFLSNKDPEVALEACEILGEIGTRKSIAGLQRLTKSKNNLLSTTAKMALDQVRNR